MESLVRQFREIWTPSSFCAEAIARAKPVPVLRVRTRSSWIRPRLDRAAFEIPLDAFMFHCVSDLISRFERKNPLGVIAAFGAAFEGDERCRLVLKIDHAERQPNRLAEMRNSAAGLPANILARTIDRADIIALMNCCDCLTSLLA